MKTKRHIVIILSLFSIIISCHSQKEKDTPLLKKINTTIDEMEAIIGISEMSIGLSIESNNHASFDSKNNHNFKTLKKQQSDTTIHSLIHCLLNKQ